MKILLFSLLIFSAIYSYGKVPIVQNSSLTEFSQKIVYRTNIEGINLEKNDTNFQKTKLIAISLAITLGAFGVHRLYLGTKPIVPLAYTLTLGGGFLILPLVDIFYIIIAKDIEDITQNEYVFMWSKKKSNTKVP